MAIKKFYLSLLNSVLKQRVDKNASYSIRSYARDLNIDSSSLTSILKGRRRIPKGKIEAIADKICATDKERQSFIKSANLEHVSLQTIKKNEPTMKRHLVNNEDFAFIACKDTYTLLSLLELENFRNEEAWIAKKLNLDIESVRKKISSLIDVGMIQEVGGTLVRTKQRTTTTDDISSRYIVKHHVDSLDLAKAKCLELPPGERYFSTITIPSDPKALEEVKKLILDFEDKIVSYLRRLKKKEVYKLSIQFYQATE